MLFDSKSLNYEDSHYTSRDQMERLDKLLPSLNANPASENCYSFACPPVPGLLGGIRNPGDDSGISLELRVDCATIISAALSDGTIIQIPIGGECPSGWTRVRAYMSNGGQDYHWMVEDGEGTWKNKHGQTQINPGSQMAPIDCWIKDPYQAAADFEFRLGDIWFPGYDLYCGEYCARRR